jgi:lysine-N-methylase
MLRHHQIDGEDKALIFDTRKGEAIEISCEELELLACADGTRDLGGIMLEATRRGVYRRASSVTTILTALHARGLLADGIPREPQAVTRPADDVPLDVIDDFSLVCDLNGSCCSTYSSIALTVADTHRVRAAIDEDVVFLPLYGSAPSLFHAASLRDGHCAFLSGDGRCEIQTAGGAEAKPRGCRIYPASFVYDGEAVRVSISVECSCVVQSIGRRDGSPLVPEGAKQLADLLAETPIAQVPDAIALCRNREATRDELRRWTRAILPHVASVEDPLGASWALAESIDTHGLDAAASREALKTSQRPGATPFASYLEPLAAQTSARAVSTAAWRSQADRSRRLSDWLQVASHALLDTAQVTARLSDPLEQRQSERFYLRASLFAYELISPKAPTSAPPLATALRDRAVRMLLARQMRKHIDPPWAHDPSAEHPITAVEAMMRGHGLASYVFDVA